MRPGTLWMGRLLVLSGVRRARDRYGRHRRRDRTRATRAADAKLKATRLDLRGAGGRADPRHERHGVPGASPSSRSGSSSRDRGPAGWCSGWACSSSLIVAQGALGYTQYFNGVPPLLVGFHVAGATAVFSATLAVLLSMYEAVPSAGAGMARRPSRSRRRRPCPSPRPEPRERRRRRPSPRNSRISAFNSAGRDADKGCVPPRSPRTWRALAALAAVAALSVGIVRARRCGAGHPPGAPAGYRATSGC